MSDLVPTDQIEQIVGAPRQPVVHLGRAVTAEQTVYILHSRACKDSGIDLRKCRYSVALDRGIDPEVWIEDQPVILRIVANRLVGDELVTSPATPANGGDVR